MDSSNSDLTATMSSRGKLRLTQSFTSKIFQLPFNLVFVLFLLSACTSPFGQQPRPTAVSTTPPQPVPTTTATPAPRGIDQIADELIVLPTLPATAVPLPSPTYSPDLADWTLLIYLDADNSLEWPALLDLNEMEAAGSSEQVNVVVQIDRASGESDADGDWRDARRYLIAADDNPNTINATLLAELGEVNMGDPLSLADFLTWGITAYPANRYALVVWDHGAGWNGIAFDSDDGLQNEADHLSLSELEYGLGMALQETGVAKLDVIGFDACLMGQLDVFQAIQPYANFAVGSEELTPGKGWDYETLLRHLYADPTQNGRQLATQMVADFAHFYTQVEPDNFVTMSAVDLALLPQVTHQTEVLAANLIGAAPYAASVIGDARSGAEAYARVYANEFEQYAAIDLHHFAAILAERDADVTVTNAAKELMWAIETAVIANERGSGRKQSQGIAIYFPRNGRFYAPNYSQVTQLPTWNSFLTRYHEASQADATVPTVQIVNSVGDNVGLQKPFYLDWEIAGRDIENAVLLAGLHQENGRRRLLEYDNLIPEPTHLPDGSKLSEWRDGIHEDFFIWDTQVTYLFDSSGSGGFVIMWPTTNMPLEEGSVRLFSVPGRFRRANDTLYQEATLVFDHHSGQLQRVWSQQTATTAAEILPQAGDEFQLYDYFLEPDETIVRELGGSLFFDEAGQLYFDWRPLPNGRYFIGFRAENIAGQSSLALTDVTVDNSNNLPDYHTYLDPYLGFQFRYPAAWYAPRYDNELLYTSNISGTTVMQAIIYPNLAPSETNESIRQQTLAEFGAVEQLYEDEVDINGRLGLRTVYGYTPTDGQPRTGVLVTFVRDGTGFALDVDGLLSEETATLTAVEQLVSSWSQTAVGIGLQPGNWARLNLDHFSVAQPADFTQRQTGDWQKFTADDNTFIALRTNPASYPAAQVIANLASSGGQDVANYTVGKPFRTLLGSAVWQRVDFSYQNADGEEIWGFIMVKVEADQEIVAWAEAPRPRYNNLEAQVFLVMIADLTLTP